MLAILGFATVGLLLAVIMSRRMSPLVALIAVPTVAAVLAGMGGQIGRFVLSGLQQTAPVAAMFVFAILYFGVMTDAGLLDPIVDRILRVIGTRPRRVVMGAALLALLVHLDGSGAVTFLKESGMLAAMANTAVHAVPASMARHRGRQQDGGHHQRRRRRSSDR